MIIEVHVLQSFGPSNLNRDDTGSPKDCVFGGTRRARISSQSAKRAMRKHPAFAARISDAGGELATRTKLIAEAIAEELRATHGVPEEPAGRLSALLVRAIGPEFNPAKPGRTKYLLYFGPREVQRIAAEVSDPEVRETLLSLGPDDPYGDLPEKLKSDATWKSLVRSVKGVVGKHRQENEATSADIALFGRMVADAPHMQIEAATQVAHAISTHEVNPILDYFTAVDDVDNDQEEREQTGAGMVGITELNSACYYRYANVDLSQLERNLAFNGDLRDATVLGFVETMIKAIPTGKQHSTAAQSPPYAVRVLGRSDGFPWALTGAFSKPVRATSTESIEEISWNDLSRYYDGLAATYGTEGVVLDSQFVVGEEGSLPGLLDEVASFLRAHPSKE